MPLESDDARVAQEDGERLDPGTRGADFTAHPNGGFGEAEGGRLGGLGFEFPAPWRGEDLGDVELCGGIDE
jgi:hypothetical protein